MTDTNGRLCLGRPAVYQIEVQGRLTEVWSDWFDDMAVTVEDGKNWTVTMLVGALADQAALHGVLARIRDLGLPLLLVRYVESAEEG